MTGPALVKYAPTAAEIQTVQKELEKHGLTILSVDPDNFSIRAHGTTANLEAAFQTHIHSYSLNGKTFKANVENAHLTGAAGSLVAQVSGLEQHHATPMTKYALNPRTKKPYPHIAISKVKAAQASGGGLSNFITADCLQAPTTSVSVWSRGLQTRQDVRHPQDLADGAPRGRISDARAVEGDPALRQCDPAAPIKFFAIMTRIIGKCICCFTILLSIVANQSFIE